MERLTIEKIKSLKEAMRSNMNVYFYDDVMKVFDELLEKRNAEEQGLLLRLPCPIGTTVYFVEKRCNADSAACYGGCEKCADYSISSTIFDFDMISHVGNFYFLTKEEAEQALARMEEENG